MFTAALAGRAAVYQEDFSKDPATTGWQVFGNSNLFRWHATNQNLEITWDSSRPNSYFFFPLHTIVAKSDDFSLSFDLRMYDIQFGTSPGKTNTFQVSLGLMNCRSATNVNFYRGAGINPTYGVRNLMEWDFFPDDGFGATWATTVVSTNNRILPAHNFPLELTAGVLYHIVLTYASSNQILRTSATQNGSPYGLPPQNTLQDVVLTSHPDFRLDSFGIMSYSDAVQTGLPSEWGSILAHGSVDNIAINVPAPIPGLIAQTKTNGVNAVRFGSKTNWIYTLERSTNTLSWAAAFTPSSGNGGSLVLPDTNAPGDRVFYRVRGERP